MKKFAFGLIGIAVSLCILLGVKPVSRNNFSNASESFAVVELFTSEGCNSCPPADRLLGDIVAGARAWYKPVYALAFHVDYWNYLGWKDIYSCKAYSLRQKKYAQKLNSYVYTPQMIIDGKYQFVGSDRSKAHHYIDKALNRKRDLQLSIDVKMNASNGNVNIDYSLDQLPENSVMHFALVERGLERDVKKGENRGRILHHDNVVRVFRTIQLMNKKGSRELPIPEDVDESMASIIVYTQKTDGKIVAAKGQDLL